MGRIGRISDLSEEEKEKWKAQVYARYQEGLNRKQQEIEEANNSFNSLRDSSPLGFVKNINSQFPKNTTNFESVLGSKAYNNILRGQQERENKNNIVLPYNKSLQLNNRKYELGNKKNRENQVDTQKVNLPIVVSADNPNYNELNNSNMNIWNRKDSDFNKYGNDKLFKEKNLVDGAEQVYKDYGNGKLSSSKFIAKKAGVGVAQGTVGIGQAVLTETANNLEKGASKSEAELVLDAVISFCFPTLATSNEYNQKFMEILNNKDMTTYDKAIQLLLNSSSTMLDNLSLGKPLIDSSIQMIGKVNPNSKDMVMQANDAISKPVEEWNTQLAKEAENYDQFTQTLGNAGQSIGNMLPSLGASLITKDPNVGLATMAASAKGQSTQEALNKGATLEQAKKIGDAKMWIEVGTEKLTGGLNHFGNGFLDDFVESNLSKIKSDIVRKFVEKGIVEPGEEIAEETISDILGFLIDKGTTDPDAEYTWEDWLDTAITTALSTYGLNVINSQMNKIYANRVNKKLNNNSNSEMNTYGANENGNISNYNNKDISIINSQDKMSQNQNTGQISNILNNKQLLKDIANNQEALYNINGSESGVNEQYKRNIDERGNRVYEEQKINKNREYSWEEYNQWEKSIKPITKNNLTNNEKELITKTKREHGKDLILYDENENSSRYSGGASQIVKDRIMISRQKAKIFGLENMTNHEIVESDILFNNDAENILSPVIDLITEDANFELQKQKFWENQEGNIPSDKLIAKDIICDRFSEIKEGNIIDYKNVLNNATNTNIDIALSNYYKQVYGRELGKSSNSLSTYGLNGINSQLNKIYTNRVNKKLNNNSNSEMNTYTANENGNITNSNNKDISVIDSQDKMSQNQNTSQISNILNNKQLLKDIANNQEALYNINGSESGINGSVQQQGMLESDRVLPRVYENSLQQEERKYTRTEYEQWEQSIRQIEDNKLTNEQQKIRNTFKGQYGKDIVFFDGNTNNNIYSGGASYLDSNRINIDIRQAENFGLNKMTYHELLESNILHNQSIKLDIIEPTIRKIISDGNFEMQKKIFWENQKGNMPNDYLIAKDILCDRYSEIKTGEDIDYTNMLSQETNMTIDFAIENFEKQMNTYGANENGNISNYNNKDISIINSQDKMPQNQNTSQISNILNNKQLLKDIANNQEALYNINGSESGLDGKIQSEGLAGISGQFDTDIFKNNTQSNQRRYTRTEYEKWESSIKPIKKNNITNEQDKIIENLKRQYNKDIVFFDAQSSQYLSGASLTNNKKIYVDEGTASKFGLSKVINHEIMESDIRHNRDLSNDIIQPSIKKIIEDSNFQKQKDIFWKKESEKIPSDYAIAKEILCDRFAELKTGEQWDYENVLSKETNMTIDYSLNNFHKELYGIDIQIEQNKNNIVYDIDTYKGSNTNENYRLQLPSTNNSIASNNSISQNPETVKGDINNNFMQNIKNNTSNNNMTNTSNLNENANISNINSNNISVITSQDKMSQNQNVGQLSNMLNNKELPLQSYIYEKSNNVKIDNLRQDANKYFNNSEQTNNYIKMLEKIIEDKNVTIRLNPYLRTKDGKIANGSYSNGVITINPNSTRAGEFIAIHELTHAIGTKSMKNIIDTYRKSNVEFNSAVEKLLENYNEAEITEEALSDVSAQLFGNQEFINNMAQNSSNIFQKIYSEIKYLWHQFRGYKNQNQFVEDLYYKWSQAYNSNNNINTGSYYSIQTDNNGKKYIKVDTDQNIFDGIDRKDYNKIAKMYIQDYLMGETNLNNSDNAIIDSKSASKYTNPHQRTSYMAEKMRLTPELKNVLEIAQKESISLPTKENSKYKSWEYYKFNFKLNGKNFEGLINIGIDKNGNKHFYEINKIRFTGISSVSTNSQHKTNSINTSIPSLNKDVNTTKYSMQESENNSNWQSYLENNFKTKGTTTSLKDIGLPLPERIMRDVGAPMDIQNKGQSTNTEILTNADYDVLNKIYEKEGKTEILPKQNNVEVGNVPVINTDTTKTKQELNNIQNKINEIENITDDIEYISHATELEELNDRKALLEAKIDEIENTPDTINNIVRKRSDNKTLKQKARENYSEFQKDWVNEYYDIDKLAKDTNNPKLAIALDNWLGSSHNADTTIDGKLNYGLRRGTGQTDINNNVIGESITEILRPLYKDNKVIEFTDYLLNLHNIDRVRENKAIFPSASEIQSKAIAERYEKSNPMFKERAEKVYNFLGNELQNAVDAGLGTQEQFDYIREKYPYYVPSYRNLTELRNFIDNGEISAKMIQKAMGGSESILAIDVAMSEYTMSMRRKIALNNLLIELNNSLSMQENLDNYADISEKEDFMNANSNNMIFKNSEGTFATYYENGEPKTFEIPGNIYELLKPKELPKANFIQNILSSVNSIFRKSVTTYSPAFTGTNMLKDFQNGLYNTKYTAPVYMKNYLYGLEQIITNGEYYKKYKNSGLQGNSRYSKNSGMLTKASKNVFQRYNPVSVFNEFVENINTGIESSGRMAEFISSLRNGNDITTAKLEAAEITLNFKRGGKKSKIITKYLSPFFNSATLATNRNIQNITGKRGTKALANFYTMVAISGVGSIINHLILKDDEDYKALPDYIKDGYYLIPKGDGTFYRISKDAISTTIGSVARRTLEMASGEEDVSELGDMFATIFDNLGVANPLTNNIVAPFVQATTNKSWYGEDIVSSSLQGLAPELQYDARTSEISKSISNEVAKLPLPAKNILGNIPIVKNVYDIASSPKKLDYIMGQYSGGVGKIVLPMTTPYAEENYLEREFTTNSTLKSKYPGEFYEALEEAERNYKSYGKDELKYKYLNSVRSEMSNLYKQKREIEYSNSSDEDKRKRMEEVQKQINNITKNALDNMDKVKENNITATIDDKKYYKENNLKGDTQSWTELSDKEMEKNKYISTNTYADYKQKVYTKKKEKISKGELKEKQDLKNVDKIQILLDSKYSQREKMAIYENYIISSNDKEFKFIKASNMNFEEYLKFKQQDFTSDKTDDGTLNGKTVSKSKQKKVTDYLNDVYNRKGITGNQSLLLYAMQGYSTTSSQKNQLANYVNNQLNLKPEEKLELFNRFSGFTVYKNGDVKW